MYISLVSLCSGPIHRIQDYGDEYGNTTEWNPEESSICTATHLVEALIISPLIVTASIGLPASSFVHFPFIFSAAIAVVVFVFLFLKHIHLILRLPNLNLSVILSCVEDKVKHKPLHMVLPLKPVYFCYYPKLSFKI